MSVMVLERKCPMCGHPMYLLPDSGITYDGIRVIDAICENCLHIEQVTTVVAKKGK